MTTETQAPEVKKKPVVEIREISFLGIMSEADQDLVTGLSRVTRWRLERDGKFPKRVQLSPGRQGRRGPEIKKWLDSLSYVDPGACESETGETVST